MGSFYVKVSQKLMHPSVLFKKQPIREKGTQIMSLKLRTGIMGSTSVCSSNIFQLLEIQKKSQTRRLSQYNYTENL